MNVVSFKMHSQKDTSWLRADKPNGKQVKYMKTSLAIGVNMKYGEFPSEFNGFELAKWLTDFNCSYIHTFI